MEVRERAIIRASINNAWAKLDDYYTRLEESPLWVGAVLLNPNLGLRWLRRCWKDPVHQVWLAEGMESLKAYFDRWYPVPNDPTIVRAQQQQGHHRHSRDDGYQSFLNPVFSDEEDDVTSELERYYSLGSQGKVDPVHWWIDHKQQFPRLSTLALDILAIPAMAADCERSFSIAKLSIGLQRHSMKPEMLEMLQLLKDWLQSCDVSVGGLLFCSI
jgi:hypothetical protein